LSQEVQDLLARNREILRICRAMREADSEEELGSFSIHLVELPKIPVDK
jgi:hypothetical protein